MSGARTALDLALTAIDQGEFALAVSRLRVLLEGQPNDRETRLALARALVHQGRVDDASSVVRPLLSQPDLPPADRAIALAVAAMAGTVLGDASADQVTREAIEIDDRSGPGASLAWNTTAIQRYLVGDLHAAVEAAERAVAAASRASPMLRTDARVTLAMMLMHADRFADADALLVTATDDPEPAAARALRHRALGALRFHAGQWDGAALLLDPRADVAAGIDLEENEWALAAGLLAVLLVHEDRLDEARRLLADAVWPMAPGQSVMLSWAAVLLAEADEDLHRAAQLADRVIATVERSRSFVRFRLFGPDLVRVSLAVGEIQRAQAVEAFLWNVAARARTASVDAAAHLCSAMVRRDPAQAARAAELYRASPRPLDRALALDAFGSAATADRDDAAVNAEREALDIYMRLGAVRDARRMRARLRGRGVIEIEHRPPRERAHLGWTSLSPAERAVAALVADGLSNGEIAARLFVSPRTVETHVAHLFRKLGVTSRAGVASAATRAASEGRSRHQLGGSWAERSR